MLIKKITMVIILLVIGMVVIPKVQAQTQQQQQELEQIAKRSVNGLSSQDRQRVIQIMTDVYVAQGMSRQQAAMIAEIGADSMFSSDIGEMSATERQQFAEQGRMPDYLQDGWKPTTERQRQPGNTEGWPTALLREWEFPNLRQPAGTQASYNSIGNPSRLETLFLTDSNTNTLQEIKRQIETTLGRQMEGSGQAWYITINRTKGSTVRLNLEGSQLTLYFFYSGN